MFFGRTATRFDRSRTATPVNSMFAPLRKACDLDRGACRRIAELEVLGVDLVHHVLRHLVGQIRIDEHDMPEVHARRFQRFRHCVESGLNLLLPDPGSTCRLPTIMPERYSRSPTMIPAGATTSSSAQIADRHDGHLDRRIRRHFARRR